MGADIMKESILLGPMYKKIRFMIGYMSVIQGYGSLVAVKTKLKRWQQ
jgi:hypothetical protein